MFAASGNEFANNGSIGTSGNTLEANKAWLPTTAPLTFDSAKKAYHFTFNGIKWESKVVAPTGVEFVAPSQDGNVDFNNKTTESRDKNS